MNSAAVLISLHVLLLFNQNIFVSISKKPLNEFAVNLAMAFRLVAISYNHSLVS